MKRYLAPPVLLCAFLGGALAGCNCQDTGFSTLTFKCASDADCIDGQRCLGEVCSAAAGGGNGGGLGGGSGGGSAGGLGGGGGGGGGGANDGGCLTDEVCDDLVDDNCNGILDDGCPCTATRPCYRDGLASPTLRYPWDGGGGCAVGQQECLGTVYASVCSNQHLPQVEYCDGQDTNCNGIPDDGCGCIAGYPCYQGRPFTNGAGPLSSCRGGTWTSCGPDVCAGQVLPALVEVCNGLDDDCNGQVDDNAATQPCGLGVCSSVMRGCDAGVDVCNPAVNPPPSYSATEVCGDGLDNNCEGQVDEGCTCVLDAGLSCFTGPSSACPADGGACLPVCQRGVQVCQTFADGGSGYGGCTGQVLPSNEVCSDGLDNDCDGLVDCADADCTGRECGSNRTCSGGTCSCQVDGGTTQATETLCADGRDNDCNGLFDCADATCGGLSCGAFGQRCSGTGCVCAVDGGVVQAAETVCDDGLDNDCDGLRDCAESACAGLACTATKTCIGGSCTCVDAGVPQTTESTCSDGRDNDCDGLIDCADPTCSGRSCGTRNGFQCSGTSCLCSGNGAPAQAPETSCLDGRDNDCDGLTDCADPDCPCESSCSNGADDDGDLLVDCADPDCNHRPCSASASAAVCCGTGPNATACKNLGADVGNCGGCGLTCGAGQSCQAMYGNGESSGTCTCAADAGCPTAGQSCRASSLLCDCTDTSSACPAGAHCTPINGSDFCHY